MMKKLIYLSLIFVFGLKLNSSEQVNLKDNGNISKLIEQIDNCDHNITNLENQIKLDESLKSSIMPVLAAIAHTKFNLQWNLDTICHGVDAKNKDEKLFFAQREGKEKGNQFLLETITDKNVRKIIAGYLNTWQGEIQEHEAAFDSRIIRHTHYYQIKKIVKSPNGNWIATLIKGVPNLVKFWNIYDPTQIEGKIFLEQHTIYNIDISDDYLFVGPNRYDGHKYIDVYNIAMKQRIASLPGCN